MIIIDPNNKGVTIYRDGCVSGISGSIKYVCGEIIKRTCSYLKESGLPKQIISISVVSGGIGMAYIHELENYGLNIRPISFETIDNVLPRINREDE